jgi:hypothetical protein
MRYTFRNVVFYSTYKSGRWIKCIYIIIVSKLEKTIETQCILVHRHICTRMDKTQNIQVGIRINIIIHSTSMNLKYL